MKCLEDRGIDEDEVQVALTDRGTAGGDALVGLAEGLFICAPRTVDDPQWIAQQAAALSASTRASISADETRCFFGEVVASPNPGAMFDGSDLEGLLAAFDRCLTPENLAIVAGAPGTGPQNYGDDPTSDHLYDRCGEGVEYACDLLLWASAAESEYFVHAYDCAGRGTTRAFCTDGVDDRDANGFADDESIGWPRVRDECEGGDMFACDFAFRMSELGSIWQRTGETCGGRLAFAPTTCVDRFGEQAAE